MTNYKLTNLNEKTPEAQQNRLKTNLTAIDGVDTVALHPGKSEISLAFQAAHQPKKEVIESAVTKSGFTLGSIL